MKLLAFAITLVLTTNSLAVAPYGIRGQEQATNLYSNVHQFPNNQVTNLGGINALVETGNYNLLVNPSFEHLTASTGWTSSGVSPAQSTVTVIHGKKALCFTATAQTFTLSQNSTTNQAQFASNNVSGLASIRILSNHTGAITVTNNVAGVASTVNALTVNASNTWGLYQIPFQMGATSNGISISAASGTGTTCIDDSYVGMATVLFSQSLDTSMRTYAPVYSNFGTPTSTVSQWSQVGDKLHLDFKFNCGTSLAATAAISLPVGFTVNAGGAGNTVALGNYQRGGSGGTGFSNAKGGTVLGTHGATVINFSSFDQFGTSTMSPFGTANGTSVCDSSLNIIGFNILVPVNELQASTPTFTSGCTTDQECANVFSFTVAGGGAVTNEPIDFINGNCTNAAPRVCTFNTGIFVNSPPNCTIDNDLIAAYTSNTSISITGNTNTTRVICTKGPIDFKAMRTIKGTFYDTGSFSRYTGSSTSLSGALATLVFNTADAQNTVAMPSGLFTCPSTGKYQVNMGLHVTGTIVLNTQITCQIQVNSVAISEFLGYSGGATTGQNCQLSDIVYCPSGQQIRIQASSGAATPAASNTIRTFVSIIKIKD